MCEFLATGTEIYLIVHLKKTKPTLAKWSLTDKTLVCTLTDKYLLHIPLISFLVMLQLLPFIYLQFWAAYVPCEAQHRDAVQLTLEQIDVIKRLTDRYSPQLTTCTSAQGK